jgi:ABC-type amino acid transport substrate-binding protein
MYRSKLSTQPSMMTNQLDPRSRAPILRVGAAFPDPPFEFMTKNGPAGFDIMLMKRIAEILGCAWQLVPYAGGDFNGIFAGLDDGQYDCVASGTTVTPSGRRSPISVRPTPSRANRWLSTSDAIRTYTASPISTARSSAC